MPNVQKKLQECAAQEEQAGGEADCVQTVISPVTCLLVLVYSKAKSAFAMHFWKPKKVIVHYSSMFV